jgi:hypothetical protein
VFSPDKGGRGGRGRGRSSHGNGEVLLMGLVLNSSRPEPVTRLRRGRRARHQKIRTTRG